MISCFNNIAYWSTYNLFQKIKIFPLYFKSIYFWFGIQLPLGLNKISNWEPTQFFVHLPQKKTKPYEKGLNQGNVCIPILSKHPVVSLSLSTWYRGSFQVFKRPPFYRKKKDMLLLFNYPFIAKNKDMLLFYYPPLPLLSQKQGHAVALYPLYRKNNDMLLPYTPFITKKQGHAVALLPLFYCNKVLLLPYYPAFIAKTRTCCLITPLLSGTQTKDILLPYYPPFIRKPRAYCCLITHLLSHILVVKQNWA